MKFDTKNLKTENSQILPVADFLETAKDGQLWNYMGLTVEIDPTVDYQDGNVLVRWTDIHEGFNDKFIINSLAEFKKNFRPLN